jgi:hypothetical protein
MNIREFIIDMNVFNVQTATQTSPLTGLATLASGAVTVNNPSVKSTSRIFLTPQAGILNAGTVWVSSRVENTSFTITSANVLDARVVAYQIYE